ncbi:MAG: DUF4037 domain-containing protein [Chloroflexota bacterium]
MTRKFVSGLELSRRFYMEIVRPILDQHFTNLPHAAGWVGTGSDVLGFDTETSTDHDWGPAVLLFLQRPELEAHGKAIREVMGNHLPFEFLGYPTHNVLSLVEENTYHMAFTEERPIYHNVWPLTVEGVFQHHIGLDITQPLDILDWLTIPSQLLRGFTSGAVHHDGVGDLTAARERLAWYPHDVWLYMLAAGWWRIEASESFVGRTGEVDDEIGSALIGARLVRDVMSQCFLMEQVYAPYPKWFGSAFAQLGCAPKMTPLLQNVLRATEWRAREAALVSVYRELAMMHNALGLTEPLPTEPTPYFARPFLVIHGENFVEALSAEVTDPKVRALIDDGIIGNIDQWSDYDELKMFIAAKRNRARGLYRSSIPIDSDKPTSADT